MTKQMGVPQEGITVLVELLGQAVSPNQLFRELSVNSFESMDSKRHPTFKGERKIVWTWDEHFLSSGIYKACIIDTGVGMTPDELEKYINNLSSSGGVCHGLRGNYGMGAKIAALTVNHHGVIYQSWRDGVGHMIHIWKDPKTDQFGLREFDIPNTHNKYIYKLPKEAKPKEITDNGTKVILLGMREDENTYSPLGKELVWIPRYLNSKFYKIPENIEFRFESLEAKNNRTINGMHKYLVSKAEKSGVLAFPDVDIHWWILAKTGDSRSHQDKGHVAAIYQDELYDIRSGKLSYSALSQFGIAFGASRVVIYVEPKGLVSADAPRSNLYLGYDPLLGDKGKGEPLPWEDWGKLFYQNMPQELQDLQAEERGDSSGSNVKDLLNKVREFFDISRKSFKKPGKVKGAPDPDVEMSNEDDMVIGGDTDGNDGNSRGRSSGTGNKGRSKTKKTSSEDNPYCKFNTEDASGEGYSSSTADGPYPDYKWIDDPENYGLAGFAATYSQVTNMIIINRKFGGFVDLREKLIARSTVLSPLVQMEISDSIEKWFGLSLLEAVLGINSIKDLANWDQSQVDKALSNEALTTMCMQRYYTVQSIRRETSMAAKYSKERAAAMA